MPRVALRCTRATGAVRPSLHIEPAPVVPRRQAGDADEYLPECACVAIADIPRDPVDGQLAELQQFARLANAQPLAIFGRRQAGGLLEAAQECALFQSGSCG